MPSADAVEDVPAPPGAGVARSYAADLIDSVGKQVLLCGWVEKVQHKGDRVRMTVRDRTGSVSAVCRDPEAVAALEPATPECAVAIVGTVLEARGGSGAVLAVERVAAMAPAASPLPLEGKADIHERLNRRFFDLRAPDKFAIFNIRATVESAMRDYLNGEGFIGIHTPKISGGGSESGAAVFELPYFGESACLVQSVQFYAQMAIAAGFDRIYEIGPVFRAENSVTNRHATEFTCLHIEFGWIDSHETLMKLEEDLIRHTLSAVSDRHGPEIERHFGLRVKPFEEPIPRISLAEAVEALGEDPEIAETGQVSARMERDLGKYVHENFGHDFVFLTDYPRAARPFYTKVAEADDQTAASTRSFDLLWRGVEITSGCEREHHYDRLRAQAEEDLEQEAIEHYLEEHYLEMFRFGCPPHGGFGIGIDRFLMILLAQSSLRETCLIFRGPERFMP
ncbi:MAG TPA: aspartate--tRNA(Asn) ligase [Solirubrobacterales bacterium]|nr:aspartate--tRNA(Asn) ligase [Solirubrobacterales bacterium]